VYFIIVVSDVNIYIYIHTYNMFKLVQWDTMANYSTFYMYKYS